MIREYWDYISCGLWLSALVFLMAMPLGGCSTAQLATAAPYVQAGNTAGAIIAGIVQPAIAIPAGVAAGALNGAITTATGK